MGRAERDELAKVGEPAIAAEEPRNGEQDGFFERSRGGTRAVGAADMTGLLGLVGGVGPTPAREVILNRQPLPKTCRQRDP